MLKEFDGCQLQDQSAALNNLSAFIISYTSEFRKRNKKKKERRIWGFWQGWNFLIEITLTKSTPNEPPRCHLMCSQINITLIFGDPQILFSSMHLILFYSCLRVKGLQGLERADKCRQERVTGKFADQKTLFHTENNAVLCTFKMSKQKFWQLSARCNFVRIGSNGMKSSCSHACTAR